MDESGTSGRAVAEHGTASPPLSSAERRPEIDHRGFWAASAVPTLTVDVEESLVIEVNPAAEAFIGLPAAEIVGRPSADFVGEPSADHVLRLDALRGACDRAVASMRTSAGSRTVEVNEVPAGPAGLVFVQVVDLTDILNANAELEGRSLELQKKTAALESVASRMAHDLRSPLASIAGFSDLLLRDDFEFDDAQRLQMLERISTNAKSLSEMISEVMAEAQGYDLSGADDESEIDGLFSSLRAIIDADLAAAEAELVTSSDVDDLPVPAATLRQPVLNLVSNSLKYRMPGRPTVVELHVTEEDGHAVIRVRDNGRGVGVDVDPEMLFRKGARGASAMGTVGSGLGLPFSRQAIRDLGGDLVFERPDGIGACFRIDLPDAAELEERIGPRESRPTPISAPEFEQLFVSAVVPSVLVDLERHRIVRVSGSAEELLGASSKELIGRKETDLLADPLVGEALVEQLTDKSSHTPFELDAAVVTAAGDRKVRVLATRPRASMLAILQFRDL